MAEPPCPQASPLVYTAREKDPRQGLRCLRCGHSRAPCPRSPILLGPRRSTLPLIPWRRHGSRPGEAQSKEAACYGWAVTSLGWRPACHAAPPTRPPAPRAGAEERHLRPPFRFSAPNPGGHGRGWDAQDGVTASIRSGTPSPRGGEAAQGGSQPAAPQGEGEGTGTPASPRRTAVPRLRASDRPWLSTQQAQAGSRGRGGQQGKQGASPRTSPKVAETDQPIYVMDAVIVATNGTRCSIDEPSL